MYIHVRVLDVGFSFRWVGGFILSLLFPSLGGVCLSRCPDDPAGRWWVGLRMSGLLISSV